MYDNQFSERTKPPSIMGKADITYTDTEIRIKIICKKCGTPWERMGVKCPAPGCGSKKFNQEVKAVSVPMRWSE